MTGATAEAVLIPLLGKNQSAMPLLPWGLLGFLFQETAMLRRGIATEVNSAGIAASLSPLPRGGAGSSVHGIELSVLAQWAFNQALWRRPTFAHPTVRRTERMSNCSYGKPFESDRYSAQRQTACDS